MNQQALVSIVIPSYNHEKFIGEAIESILKQSYQKFEIIIIDDGSTDGSREILAGYEPDSRFKIFYQENQGAAFAINAGLAKASGDYVAILNSDDVYHPERLATLLKLHEEQPCGDVVLYTNITFIDQESKPLIKSSRAQFYEEWMEFYKKFSPENHFIHGNLLTTTSNLFFTKKNLAKIGDFLDLRYCHDWEWVIRANQVAKIILVDQDLLQYRIHDNNTILEQDLVRHSLENAFVFSSLIDTKKSRQHKVEELLAEVTLFTKSRYFYSFMIVVVLYVRNNLGTASTQELLKNGVLSGYFDNILSEFEKSKEAFFSINHVEEVISSLRNTIENYNYDVQRGRDEICRLQEKVENFVENHARLIENNKRLTEKNTRQKVLNSEQAQQISQLKENDALKDGYLHLIEKSFVFRISLYFEDLRRKAINWRRMLKRFSVLNSNLISSDLSSNARYLYHIDWPEFDSAKRYSFKGQEKTLPISGWIIDVLKNRSLDNVIIAADGSEQILQPTLLRPAVVAAFRSKKIAYCGFKVRIPINTSKQSIFLRIGFMKDSQKIFSQDEFEVLIN